MNVTEVYEKPRGSIRNLLAYAQGKLLNSEEWHGLLPRNITPSDIDLVFANGQSFLFVEFGREDSWRPVSQGQKRLYHDIVKRTGAAVWAVYCKHSVPNEVQIYTMSDVEHFHPMVLFNGAVQITAQPIAAGENGSVWRDFVTTWYRSRGECERVFIQPNL